MRQGKIKGSFNMNQYEEKRQARIERMKARAARAREESGQLGLCYSFWSADPCRSLFRKE